MERNRRPPDVEEALSSMLWTPYERTSPNESDIDEETTSSITRGSMVSAKKLPSRSNSFALDTSGAPIISGTKSIHYGDPVRRTIPHYRQFEAKRSTNVVLPTYEHIEKERLHYQNMAGSIFVIPQYQSYNQPRPSQESRSRLVNSFTDDFMQYQNDFAVSMPSNRFSNDFSSLDVQAAYVKFLNSSVDVESQSASKYHGNIGDLLTASSGNGDHIVEGEEQSDNDDDYDVVKLTAANSPESSVVDVEKTLTFDHKHSHDHDHHHQYYDRCLADLPQTFGVSKPHVSQSQTKTKSRGTFKLAQIGRGNSVECTSSAFSDASDTAQLSCVSNVVDASAHASRTPNAFEEYGRISESVYYSRNNSNGAMRLNVPAAVHTALVAATNSVTTMSASAADDVVNLGALMPPHDSQQDQLLAENSSGHFIGTIVPQPSLTIQVNQSDYKTTTDRDCHAQYCHQLVQSSSTDSHSSGGISIVNCYRAVPVQIVNNNNNNTTHSSNLCNSDESNVMISGTSSSGNIHIISSENGYFEKYVNQESQLVQVDQNENNQNINNVQCDSASAQIPKQRNTIERTYTSTEAQTDDLQSSSTNSNNHPSSQTTSTPLTCQSPSNGNHGPSELLISREQRRRERRERRQARSAARAAAAVQQQQRLQPSILHTRNMHALSPPLPHINRVRQNLEILPDLLNINAHLPPPYTTLPHNTAAPSSSPSVPPSSQPPTTPVVVGPPDAPTTMVPPIITALPIDDGRYSFPLPIIRRSPSERSGKGCCGQWFAGPPLRAVIAIVALGGVACALGGAALGATGLAGPPASHLTAALLMIGVGVVLLTVSGAAWRMTAPGNHQCLGLAGGGDLGRCGRRPCTARAPNGLLYPEFQHRPPPPSYQASMQEYRLRLLLLDRDRQAGVVRGASPPPTYRSHAGSLLRIPLSARFNPNNGPGSEYSLPPSYHQRHQNATRISTPSLDLPNTTCGPTPPTNDTQTVTWSETSNFDESGGTITTATITTISCPAVSSAIPTTSTATIESSMQSVDHNANETKNSGGRGLLDAITNGNISIDLVEFVGVSAGGNCVKDDLINSSKTNEIKFCKNADKLVNLGCLNNNNVNSRSSSNNPNVNQLNNNNDGGHCKDLVTIVTISGCTDTESSTGEMDVLAHL